MNSKGSNDAVYMLAGETLVLSTGTPSTVSISIEYNGSGGTDDSICLAAPSGGCDGHIHTAQLDGTYMIQGFTGNSGTVTVQCGANLTPPAIEAGGTSAGVVTAQGTGALTAGAASSMAVGSAISNAINGSGPAVSTQGIFLTTGGSAGMSKGWVSLQGRSFDGDVDGRAYEFTLGTDFQVAEGTRLGLFVSTGKADLNVSGTSVDSTALTYGPYFKTQISGMYEITGYAAFAKPEYTVGGTSYDAERRSGGLTVNANYVWGNTQVKSFLGVSGFKEDHPAAGALAAREVNMVTGSIGTKATFASGSALQPYLSISADFSRFDDGVNGRKTHSTPRLGTGFDYATGAGNLSMDVNGGRILEGTRDVEVRLKYDFSF